MQQIPCEGKTWPEYLMMMSKSVAGQFQDPFLLILSSYSSSSLNQKTWIEKPSSRGLPVVNRTSSCCM